MRHILARDERSAAYMADGYARVSGKVGVCEGPSGGGVTYILPGLAEANESSVPLLCINSDISVAARGRYTLTELDQGALMRPVTKWNTVLNRAEDLPRIFRAAFKQITTGRPGAAHIALPFDVQNGSVNKSEIWGDASFGRYPAERVAPDRDFIERAAAMLHDAASAIFICGGGVMLSEAEGELVELAERLSVPVATTISGKGSIGEDHPLAVGVVGSNGGTPETRALVDQADVVFFIGCRAGSVTTERWRHPVPGKNKIIHLDVDPAVPGANYPVAVSLVGDAKLGLRMMNEALASTHRPLDAIARRVRQRREICEIPSARRVRRAADQTGARGCGAWTRSRCRCHSGCRRGHALPLFFRLLSSAPHGTAGFLQPRSRRARLLDGGSDGRAFRAAGS